MKDTKDCNLLRIVENSWFQIKWKNETEKGSTWPSLAPDISRIILSSSINTRRYKMTSAGPEAVKVIVRCRPMNKREKELNSKVRNIFFIKVVWYILMINLTIKIRHIINLKLLNYIYIYIFRMLFIWTLQPWAAV